MELETLKKINDVEASDSFIEHESAMNVTTQDEKNCCQRWFSGIKEGSLRGSIFTLSSVTFGVGCLAFPKAFADVGLLIGITLFSVSAILSYISLKYLLSAGIEKNVLNYNNLIELASGRKLRIFADINNILLCLGVIMVYQFEIYDFLRDLLTREFGLDFEKYKLFIIIPLTLLVQIPLSLIKNMSVIQYTSFLAAISLFYVTFVIVIQSPFYYKEYMEKNPNFELGPFPTNDIGWKWLNSAGVFLFGFCNHNGLFQILLDLHRHTEERSNKVIRRSAILEIVLYLSLGFAGFFSFFYDCEPTFITRKNLVSFPNDYFMDLAKWALIVCLLCVMAIDYNIMRLSFSTLLFKGETPSFKIDFTITVVTYILSNIVVYFTKNITDILGIIGGVNTVVISFLCPFIINIKLDKNSKFHPQNIFNYLVILIISLVGVGSTVYSFMKFFY